MTGTEHINAYGVRMTVYTRADGISFEARVCGEGGWIYAVFYGQEARDDALAHAPVVARRIHEARRKAFG